MTTVIEGWNDGFNAGRLAALCEVRDEVTRIRQDQNTLLTEEGRVIATTIDAMIAKEER